MINRHLTHFIFKQILTEVKKFAQDPRHRNTDSAILSILSHGQNGEVIGKKCTCFMLGYFAKFSHIFIINSSTFENVTVKVNAAKCI